MTVEKIVWTALPHGLVDDSRTLRLSVHVAPRLENDTPADKTGRTLADFPILSDWTAALAEIEFEVEIEGLGSVVGTKVFDPPLDPDLWWRLFPPGTEVVPFTFQDHSQKDLHVFPVRPVLRFLQEVYGAAGAKGLDLLSIDDPAGPLARFTPLAGIPTRTGDSTSFHQEVARAKLPTGQRPPGRVVREPAADPASPAAGDQEAFATAYRFYHRPGSNRTDLPGGEEHVEESPKPPDFDFHERLTLLADHPGLLRRLGLVIDLEVDLGDDAGGVPSPGKIRVIPHGHIPDEPARNPWTAFDLDLERRWFGTAPRDTFRMERGLLRLHPEFVDVFQVDIDGAALKVVDFADTVGRSKDLEKRNQASATEVGVPALRTGGITVAWTSRGDQLLTDLGTNKTLNGLIESSPGDAVLYAEDVARGFRVDVFDAENPSGGKWHSLHRRLATHTITGADGTAIVVGPDIEEGYLKGVTASSERTDHPNPSDDLYLHESIFGWEGWSLSVPRPGKRIVEPGEGDDGSTLARHDPETGVSAPMITRTEVVEHSLPRLRVGHTYRFRARVSDIAGNAVEPSEQDLATEPERLETEREPYLRFDPVPSPTMLRHAIDTEGESLDRLVIRSDVDVPAADYASAPEVITALAEAGAVHIYTADTQRHLAPPKGSQLMAEQHGRLDAAIGSGDPTAIRTALRLSMREQGTFLDPMIIDPATGRPTIAQTTIQTYPAAAALPARRGDGFGPDHAGAYAYYPDDTVVLPYLPDPWAVGMSIVGYDVTGKEQFHVPFILPGAWPSYDPVRLRLSEGGWAASYADGILDITLPKAEVVRARLSSIFPDDALASSAIWSWIPEADRGELEGPARRGRHFMITPFRDIFLTHAVQHPLTEPDMTKVAIVRGYAATSAIFLGPIENHARSTGRLDIVGEWTEDLDLVTEDAPRTTRRGTQVAKSAVAATYDITPIEDQASTTTAKRGIIKHEFGDTKYRRVTYHSVATTRFREFFPTTITNDPSRIQRVEPLTAPDGSTKTALVRDILNSARPAAPDVLYVVPTFRWERDDDAAARRHVRRGGSLRIWLRRPWFSSGDGELLGVVLRNTTQVAGRFPYDRAFAELVTRSPLVSRQRFDIESGFSIADDTDGISRQAALLTSDALRAVLDDDDAAMVMKDAAVIDPGQFDGIAEIIAAENERAIRPYVTGWGLDPVWDSAPPSTPPTLSAFPAHVGWAAGLTLDELPPHNTVTVAGHEVHYDDLRKLWYCDLEVTPGSTYWPFVRLAVARYQPNSLPSAHLSRVIMTDFIQVAPDRTAEVTVGERAATVTVHGASGRNIVSDLADREAAVHFQQPGAPSVGTAVRVTVQRREPGVDSDLAWTRVGADATLAAQVNGFNVTWTGSVQLPPDAGAGGTYRLLITEVETHLRDLMPGDPSFSTSPVDLVRERVVYADTFDL